MKTTDLDAVIASVPIDKTAARQMSGGIHWTPDTGTTRQHTHAPQMMIRRLQPGTRDLTGLKYGRITVLGMLQARGDNANGALWQVRCLCGQYETRRAKRIRKASPHDMCAQCMHLDNIKRAEYFRRTGKQMPR